MLVGGGDQPFRTFGAETRVEKPGQKNVYYEEVYPLVIVTKLD
ncbi:MULTISPECIES: hypothetical protein [unclassified Moorena]|nr:MULTISPECIES: hypothetical protein [unclassified Moorena]